MRHASERDKRGKREEQEGYKDLETHHSVASRNARNQRIENLLNSVETAGREVDDE